MTTGFLDVIVANDRGPAGGTFDVMLFLRAAGMVEGRIFNGLPTGPAPGRATWEGSMEGRGVDVSDLVRSTKNFGGTGLAGRATEGAESSRVRELEASGTAFCVRGPDCAPNWIWFNPCEALSSFES